jgi:hypothetical protein
MAETLRDVSVRNEILMLKMVIRLLEEGMISDLVIVTLPSDGSPANASFIDPPTRTADLLEVLDTVKHWVTRASEMQGSGHEELLTKQLQNINRKAEKALG